MEFKLRNKGLPSSMSSPCRNRGVRLERQGQPRSDREVIRIQLVQRDTLGDRNHNTSSPDNVVNLRGTYWRNKRIRERERKHKRRRLEMIQPGSHAVRVHIKITNENNLSRRSPTQEVSDSSD